MLGTHDTLLTHDTLDDRREVWVLLSHLRPADRFALVGKMAQSAKGIEGREPPTLYLDDRDRLAVQYANVGDREADRRITQHCWGHLMLLCNTWGVDTAELVKVLELLGKGKIRVRDLP